MAHVTTLYLTDRDSSVAARSLYLHCHIRLNLMVLINNFAFFYTIMLPSVGLGEHGAGISFMIHVFHEMLLREPHPTFRDYLSVTVLKLYFGLSMYGTFNVQHLGGFK